MDSLNAKGDVTASDGDVKVTGNLTAKDVTGQNIAADSINATGTVSADASVEATNITAGTVKADEITATKNLTAQEATANTITADAITNSGKISAKDSVKVTNNLEAIDVDAGTTITAESINATGNVTATESITTNKSLEAQDVSAKTITADSITATGKVTASDSVKVNNNLTAQEVTGNTIEAKDITATKDVTANTITADTIKAATVSATEGLTATTITAQDVSGTTIEAKDITATKVTATEGLKANSITANDVTGKTITAGTITSTGNVIATEGVKATNITAKDVSGKVITADTINSTGTVSGSTITADSLTAGTVAASESVTVKDKLVVNQSLQANTVSAATVSLGKGATISGGTITTDTLQVDADTAASALSQTTVKAATAGGTVNIADADGFAITNQSLLTALAQSFGLTAGSYTSVITADGQNNIPGMIERIGNGAWNPFERQLFNIADLGNLPAEQLATYRAQFAQAYRKSGPVRALVNATSNTGAATTQAVTGMFTLGAESRAADLRAGAPASAVVDKGGAKSNVSSLWVAIKGGETKMDGGSYADQRVHVTTYQAGYDFQLGQADFLGVYVGTAFGHAQTDGSDGKRVDIKRALDYGLYGTHAFPNGSYIDYMLSAGYFKNKMSGYDMWGTLSYGCALGYGRKIRTSDTLTLNPYVRFKFDHIKTDDRAFNYNQIVTDDENALSVKLGLDVYTSYGLYGGLAYSRGLAGSLSTYVNSFAMPAQDFDDNVVYLNLGYKGNLSERTLFNLKLEKTFCDYNSWAAEARIDFRF